MTETPTSRFGLAAISGGDFIKDIDEEDQAQVAILDTKACGFTSGTLAARGSYGQKGWFYFAEDTRQLFYDTGTEWLKVAGPGASYHSWTVDDTTTPNPTATRCGSFFNRPRPGETFRLIEAVIHCEATGSTPSVFKVRTDTGHHGTLADVPGLGALTPSTTVTAVAAESPVTLATLDRITVERVTTGDSRGWSIQVVLERA